MPGISTYGDGLSYQAGVAAGTSLFGGRGHIEGELGWDHADEVLKDSRPQGAANWSSYGAGTQANPITNIQQGRLNVSSPNGTVVCATAPRLLNCERELRRSTASNSSPTMSSGLSIHGIRLRPRRFRRVVTAAIGPRGTALAATTMKMVSPASATI